ncbi:MAG: PKD domain-containing protein [Ginsengibacter sp.]
MKRVSIVVLLFLFTLPLFADHLKGGWIYYEYLGNGSNANTSKYTITVKQYMKCDAFGGQLDPEVFLGIFDGTSNQLIQTETIALSGTEFEEKGDFTCVPNPPAVCYRVDQYVMTIDLPNNTGGYTLAVQRCCRIEGIVNINNSGAAGLTYTNKIPGMINGQSYRNNSSPQFAQKDTVLVCHDAFFTFDFSATDQDGDSLSYSFVDGFLGGNTTPEGVRPNPPVFPPPPYIPDALLPYSNGYSGSFPMGPQVKINPVSGIVSGIFPSTIGTYAVAVAVNEYRGGVLIGSTRKEIHIDVGNCQLTAAHLMPKYMSCDGYSLTLKNESPTPNGSVYTWNFGDPKSGINDTSSLPDPTHVYSDTGIYVVRLKITSAGGCEDSTTTLAYVYPFFSLGFVTQGQCKNTLIQFTDTTKTTYGVVNSWAWNFGDDSTDGDTSHLKNPQYTFSTAKNYDIIFFATNNKGCSSTVTKTISIKDQPDLAVTNDTLICSIDTLQLNAAGTGSIFWAPNYNINNQDNPSPLISPDVPTKYYVTLTDPSGCQATDSVFVDVKQFVTVDAASDTGICQGDPIQLNLISDALTYKWSPAASLDNDMIKNPIAIPLVTTKFYVTGNIGKCEHTDSITVQVALYPGAGDISDTAICIGKSVQFHASGGSTYSWLPSFFLNDPNIPDPVANPDKTIRYIVAISDTLGCPKPVYDTVVVVVQEITADAGPRDTSIVVNQPLQLNATGGQIFVWTPAAGLNDPAIANPVAIVSDNTDYIVNVSTQAGCSATDTISVKVYKLLPDIYVPNAFTPNGDGKNDVFKPIPIGIKQINYFKVFDRWGVLIYSSAKNISMQSIGWDGTYKGKPGNSAVYVWMVGGVDYLNNNTSKKGTVTLIR